MFHMNRIVLICWLALLLGAQPTLDVWAQSLFQSDAVYADCDTPIKVMPLGDSITRGSGTQDSTGYRLPLYINLRGTGYNVDFVGAEKDGGGALLPFDIDHNGYSGRTADWIASQVGAFLDAAPASVILLHIGTNDLMDGQAPGQVLAEVEEILENIDQWEEDNRKVTVLLAQIINAPGSLAAISTFNELLRTMAQSRISKGDSLLLIDMEKEAGLDFSVDSLDFVDEVHPSYEGYQKMARYWLREIKEKLDWPICNLLQVELTVSSTVISTGAMAEFELRVTNGSTKNMGDLTITSPTAPNCNRTLGNLPDGETTQFTCQIPNVTGDFLHYVTVTASHPNEGEQESSFTNFITAQPVNLAPLVDLNGPIQGGGDYAITYAEDAGPLPIAAPEATISDPDQATYASALIAPVARPDGSAETLSVDTTGTAIRSVVDSATGAIQLIGPDSFDKFWRVLRSATYTNGSQNPTPGLRTVEVSVSDGSPEQNVSQTQITVVPQNDSPQIVANNGLVLLVGQTSSLLPAHLRAADAEDVASALVFTLTEAPSRGRLLRNAAPLAVGDTFSQADLDNRLVRYQHTGDAPATDAFSFRVADADGATTPLESLQIIATEQIPLFLPIVARS